MTGTAKRMWDIERVLRWAYREELPKRRDGGESGGEDSSWSPMFRALMAGPSGAAASGGSSSRGSEPHADALLVEQAVHGLKAYEGHTYSGDLGLAPSPDWFGVDQAAAVARAQRSICLLVTVNAKLASRPSFEFGTFCTSKVGSNGKPSILLDATGQEETFGGELIARPETRACAATRAGAYPAGAYCPLKWDPDPAAIVLERAEYAVWWAAIDLLAAELAGQLSTIAVLPPGAAQRPWTGEQDQAAPVEALPDQRQPATRRVSRETAEVERSKAARRPLRRGQHGPVRHIVIGGQQSLAG